MNPQINPQPDRHRAPRVGFGAAAPLILNKCDNFSVSFTTSRSMGAEESSDATQIMALFPAGQFANVQQFGNNVSGTYMGDQPYTLQSPTSVTIAQDFGGYTGWANVVLTFTFTSASVTSKSTTGPCYVLTLTQPHTPCPAGTYWNGSECIRQVVIGAPTPGSPPPFQVGVPGHVPTAPPLSTGGTNTGGAGAAATSTSSSSTKYYIAGAGVAALAAVAAYYEWGRKAVRR